MAIRAPHVALSDLCLDRRETGSPVSHIRDVEPLIAPGSVIELQYDRVGFAAIHARVIFKMGGQERGDLHLHPLRVRPRPIYVGWLVIEIMLAARGALPFL